MVTDGQADGPWERCIRHKELNPYTLRTVTKSRDRIEEWKLSLSSTVTLGVAGTTTL